MNRKSIVLSVLLLVSLPAAGGDRDLEACFDQPTNYDIGQCLLKRRRAAEEELAAATAETKKFLTPRECKAFDEAHAAWERYRILQCKLAGMMFEGGRMRGLTEGVCKITLTDKRIGDVKAITVQGRLPQESQPSSAPPEAVSDTESEDGEAMP